LPIYEYKCKKCGEKFEKRVGFFHNQKTITCPKCGSADPDREMSTFATDRSSGGSSCSPTPGRFR
jgi:putative FmdB family regulatory protein